VNTFFATKKHNSHLCTNNFIHKVFMCYQSDDNHISRHLNSNRWCCVRPISVYHKWRLEVERYFFGLAESGDGKNDELFSDDDPDRTLEDSPPVASRQSGPKNRQIQRVWCCSFVTVNGHFCPYCSLDGVHMVSNCCNHLWKHTFYNVLTIYFLLRYLYRLYISSSMFLIFFLRNISSKSWHLQSACL